MTNKKAPIIDLDFETASELDLNKVGAYTYAIHHSTHVQIMCYSINGKKTKIWRVDRSSGSIPADLRKAIMNGGKLRAWNAQFEALIWEHVCVKKMGWLEIRIEDYIDAMAVASRFGYPLSLDKCGAAVGIPAEAAKIKDGKRLMKIFCNPNKKGKWTRPADKPEEFDKYVLYCVNDISAQQAILERLPSQTLQAQEQVHWINDYIINNRGIEVDLHVSQAAVRTEHTIRKRLLKELVEITKGEITTAGQIARIKKWIKETSGIELDDLQEATVDKLLAEGVPMHVGRVLEIRKACGKASTGKYKKILECVNYADHRVRGLFQFNGAMRTSRWSGRGVQPHSFPRGKVKVLDSDIEHICNGEIEFLERTIGPYQEVLSSAIRQTFRPKKGHKFLVVDYSGIENRTEAWLTGSKRLIQRFIDKIDQYVLMATKVYHKSKEHITDGERFLGKQIILGAGYGMGGKTFSIRIADFGINLTVEEADQYIATYREEHPEIVSLWYGIGDAAVKAIRTGKAKYKKIIFQYHKGYLYIRLPNNKLLTYPDVKLRTGSWGKPEISYKENFYGKWGRTSTYGAKLVENICQAVSRELLAEAIDRLEKAGYPVVLHVHDEIVCEVPIDGDQTLEEMEEIMVQDTGWNRGLPLDTEGFECYRYRK